MKKKRILCSLLTLAMLMALLTVTAFAEGDEALTLPPEGGELASGIYQLSEDLTISSSLKIPKNSNITIDLNGHTLNTTAATWGVLVSGTCTIVDRAENGTIESGEHAFLIYSGGKLSINGGTTNASGTAIVNSTGAELIISNAKVFSSSSSVLQNQGTVTIQGAELSSNVAAGIFNLDGSVTVSDSTIYGADNGILNGLAEEYGSNPSIIISNSTVSSSTSYAVNNNLPGSSLTATKTNFIANQTNVIRNAGKLYIDADSSLTISDDQVPGRIEGDSTGVLCPVGKSWQEFVTEQPDDYVENKSDKTLTISSPEALAWWAVEIKNGKSFAGYTITISGTLDMSAYLWEPINAWGSSYGPGPLDQVTIQGQNGVIRNLSIRGNCSSINGYPYACGFIGSTKNPITVKNLTFDSANVSINGQYYGNQVGVVIGHAYCDDVIMDGVHVTNSTVKGYGKVGGLVGHLAEPDKSHSFTNCSVENTKIIGAYNCGGLIGLNEHCSVTVTNCTTKNVEWVKDPNSTYLCVFPSTPVKDYDGTGAIAQCVTGIYYQDGEIDDGQEAYIYAAWGTQYCDYSNLDGDNYKSYIASSQKSANVTHIPSDAVENPEEEVHFYFDGLCHEPMQPHTGFDDWKVTQLPVGNTPGMECGDCNIDMCGEIRTRYFWEVTFDANNGSETPWDVQHLPFENNDDKVYASEPEDKPTRPGYTFKCWTLDGEPYDFNTEVTANITLVAQWKRNISLPGNIIIPADATPALNKDDHVAYIIGYEDGTVRPNGRITRAEVATIFFRLLTDDTRAHYWSQTNSYSDVHSGDWFNNAVSTMSAAGIITGYPDGTFRPNAPITRAEFAAIVARFSDQSAKYLGTFSDVSYTHWASSSIALAAKFGWVTGYEDNTFKPDQSITRAEAMTITNRILERAVEEDHMLPDMVTWTDNRPDAWYYEAVQEATNSHTYARVAKLVPDQSYCYEEWLKIEANPDWAALEKIWSRANSR